MNQPQVSESKVGHILFANYQRYMISDREQRPTKELWIMRWMVSWDKGVASPSELTFSCVKKTWKKKGPFNYKKIVRKKVIQYYNKITSYIKIFMKKTGLN